MSDRARHAQQSRIFAMVAVLTLIMFKFQNCAEPPENLYSNDPKVGLIDGWPSHKKVAFLSATHLLSGLSQPLEIDGLCLSTGSSNKIFVQILNTDQPAEVLESQEVECVLGGFEISSISQFSNSCNDRWVIRAANVNEPNIYAETEVQVNCEN